MSEFYEAGMVGLRQLLDGGKPRMNGGQIGTALNSFYLGFDEKQGSENDAK